VTDRYQVQYGVGIVGTSHTGVYAARLEVAPDAEEAGIHVPEQIIYSVHCMLISGH
jgi:hypothetical protein